MVSRGVGLSNGRYDLYHSRVDRNATMLCMSNCCMHAGQWYPLAFLTSYSEHSKAKTAIGILIDVTRHIPALSGLGWASHYFTTLDHYAELV
jgi:hypothetical protein